MSHAKKRNWLPTQKSRRCYHRVISGIERGGQLRFLTLTSSELSPNDIQRSFRALYMRLKRRGLMKGYIKVPERTKKGKPHIHVLFRGAYIEQRLISEMWTKIHHASVVDIRAVQGGANKRKMASDMASYMSKPNRLRYSWNWDWVWRGFCKDWKELKRRFAGYNKEGWYMPYTLMISFWGACLKAGKPSMIYALPP